MPKEIDVLALAKQGLLSASHRLDSSDKQLRLLAKEEVDKILGLIELYASPQPVAFHRASFLSGYEAAQSDANFCDVPPQGWLCTRQAGHDGPCAATADDKGRELVNRAMLRLAEQEAAPQPVKQVDLTDEEIADVFRAIHMKESWSLDFARAVITADREKNK